MACDTVTINDGQTIQERQVEVKSAIERLAAAMEARTVRLQVGPQGALCIVGWEDRRKITDACAIRALQFGHSWAFRQALARAEAAAGRRADMRAVSAGIHSHDGGRTWGPGHGH